DSRYNPNHAILFPITFPPRRSSDLARPDGCHLTFQSAVIVTKAPADPFPYAEGPPMDGATLKLRIWVCGTRHPEYDISYTSGATNDAKHAPTRDVNYGKSCWPQADK